MNPSNLKKLEFELAYLVLLTRRGIKPLSRWEKPLQDDEYKLFKEFGLKTAFVERQVLSGKTVEELIFSNSEAYIDVYFRKFDNTLIHKTAETQSIEGFLFGYPPCCVEQYMKNGYQKNELSPEEQQVLFHWACRGCAITPQLLPLYKETYAECHKIFSAEKPADFKLPADFFKTRPVQATIAAGMTLAFMATNIGLYMPKTAFAAPVFGDRHQIALPEDSDADQDLLTNNEEPLLKTDPLKPDTDGNGVIDGEQLAKELLGLINQLPREEKTDEPYLIDFAMKGLEECTICGESINMGYVQIVNPLENQSIEVPYICLHYMEHGTFAYDGSLHKGRLNPVLLKVVLTSTGVLHQQPIDNDSDGDGLTDDEEVYFKTDPAIADTDLNGISDGTQLARSMAVQVDSLPREATITEPYAIDHMMRGFVICNVCGEAINMGYVEIRHPVMSSIVEIPYLGLHSMHCGSFTFSSDTQTGRVDPVRLHQFLTFEQVSNHQLKQEQDNDNDGLRDQHEQIFNLDSLKTDTDGNGVSDGVQLAQQMLQAIQALPKAKQTDQPYLTDCLMYGLETCQVCGEMVNMGYVVIYNPLEDFKIEIPYIALHFLEHGSFLYDGTVHANGEINPLGLNCALNSDGHIHMLPIEDDADQDGLKATEEAQFGFDPQNQDTDGDGYWDGEQLAKEMATQIDYLPTEVTSSGPYVTAYLTWGLESCETCGEVVNMGYIEITNPLNGKIVSIQLIGLHNMHHGSFSYNGTMHDGRVDPSGLAEVLDTSSTGTPIRKSKNPKAFSLSQNFPNPFSLEMTGVSPTPATTITFSIPKTEQVSIKIFNIAGQLVRELVPSAEKSAGAYNVVWDGCDARGQLLPSGIYFYQMKAGNFKDTRQMLIVR